MGEVIKEYVKSEISQSLVVNSEKVLELETAEGIAKKIGLNPKEEVNLKEGYLGLDVKVFASELGFNVDNIGKIQLETKQGLINKQKSVAEQEAEQKAHAQQLKEERARIKKEKQAKKEAERLALEEKRQEEERLKREAEEEAERLAKKEAEKQALLEAKRQEEEKAKQKAVEEAERLAKEEAEKKAKEEAERLALEEAERQEGLKEQQEKVGSINYNEIIEKGVQTKGVIKVQGDTNVAVKTNNCNSNGIPLMENVPTAKKYTREDIALAYELQPKHNKDVQLAEELLNLQDQVGKIMELLNVEDKRDEYNHMKLDYDHQMELNAETPEEILALGIYMKDMLQARRENKNLISAVDLLGGNMVMITKMLDNYLPRVMHQLLPMGKTYNTTTKYGKEMHNITELVRKETGADNKSKSKFLFNATKEFEQKQPIKYYLDKNTGLNFKVKLPINDGKPQSTVSVPSTEKDYEKELVEPLQSLATASKVHNDSAITTVNLKALSARSREGQRYLSKG